MSRHETERYGRGPAEAPRVAGGVRDPLALALQRRVGNRGLARVLSRMETAEAVDALAQSLGAGVLGAERPVLDTLTALSADTEGFDQVAEGYEERVKAPLLPALEGVPGAPGAVPRGWQPG